MATKKDLDGTATALEEEEATEEEESNEQEYNGII